VQHHLKTVSAVVIELSQHRRSVTFMPLYSPGGSTMQLGEGQDLLDHGG